MPYKDPEAVKANKRAYYEANREQILEYKRAYGIANREQILERKRARDITNREQILEKRRAHYAANREQVLERDRAYKAAHREQVLEKRRARTKETPAESNGRNALRRGSPYADLTTEQWNAVLTSYNHRCAYCGCQPEKLEIDHITPVTQGGAHTLHNVVPACHKCNSRKRRGPPLKPVQPLLL